MQSDTTAADDVTIFPVTIILTGTVSVNPSPGHTPTTADIRDAVTEGEIFYYRAQSSGRQVASTDLDVEIDRVFVGHAAGELDIVAGAAATAIRTAIRTAAPDDEPLDAEPF